MRKRIWIILIVILAICFMLIRKTVNHTQISSPAQDSITNYLSQPGRTSIASNQVAPNITATAVPPVSVPGSTNIGITNSIDPQVLAEWHVPIDFYGRVVDENSNGIAGANVRFHWTELPTSDGDRTDATESGPDGLFSLRDKRGRSLTVWVSKEGYYTSHNGQWGFNYALGPDIISPAPQNPIIFSLRKKGQGAELITSANGIRPNLAIRLSKDSNPVRVDFFQKQSSPTGQLEVSQNKPPWREAADWSFRMSLPDGGFVANDNEFLFEAPETDYKPTVEYHFVKGEPNWTTHFTGKFYIAFGQPRKYGWLSIESDLGQETIFLTYAINPTGSRNLEPSR